MYFLHYSYLCQGNISIKNDHGGLTGTTELLYN